MGGTRSGELEEGERKAARLGEASGSKSDTEKIDILVWPLVVALA